MGAVGFDAEMGMAVAVAMGMVVVVVIGVAVAVGIVVAVAVVISVAVAVGTRPRVMSAHSSRPRAGAPERRQKATCSKALSNAAVKRDRRTLNFGGAEIHTRL